MNSHIYLVAGEASGDLLGAGLIRALKAEAGDRKMRFSGVGGEKMEAEGLRSVFPYHELSLMGLVEVLPHITHLMGRMSALVEDILIKKPNVLITIDSPGFNFRLVEQLRGHAEMAGTLFIHYVAPTVWAYKPQRAKKCAGLFDHMLVLLPFEPPYFIEAGLEATFVGHPVAYRQEKGDAVHFREKYGLDADAPLLCLMPGSREGEIKRHMPVFGPALAALAAITPGLALVVPVHARLLPVLAPYFEGCPFRAILLGEEGEKKDALAASTAALVKSGTVSLEVARAGVPQIITYKANPVTAFIMKRLIKLKYANLINILCDREVIPELLQERCRPALLQNALEALLHDKNMREVQRKGTQEAFAKMQAPGNIDPSVAAARKVLELAGD